MAAEPPQSPGTEAVRSLEARWIFPGQTEAQVAGWLARFPARPDQSRSSAQWLSQRPSVGSDASD
jgi:hypothetical protein